MDYVITSHTIFKCEVLWIGFCCSNFSKITETAWFCAVLLHKLCILPVIYPINTITFTTISFISSPCRALLRICWIVPAFWKCKTNEYFYLLLLWNKGTSRLHWYNWHNFLPYMPWHCKHLPIFHLTYRKHCGKDQIWVENARNTIFTFLSLLPCKEIEK